METKFTKGKWEVTPYQNVYCGVNRVCTIGDLGEITEEVKANALLISKAPEMFEEIKESITDLKILKTNILQSAKLDNKWDGFAELVQQWIDRKEQLLKEATEL